MDFSTEGLRRQAMAMFATLLTLRRTLPVKLTDEIRKKAKQIMGPTLYEIRQTPVFCKWIRETIAYNKSRGNNPELAIILFVLPDQCRQKDFNNLAAQMMWVPLEGLGEVDVPMNRLEGATSLVVRVEIFLTQEEDTECASMRVMDPEDQLPADEEDWPTIRRRMHQETQVPLDIIDKIVDVIKKDPQGVLDFAIPRVDISQVSNLESKLTRLCGHCKKYGYRLGKCGGCKAVYYCSTECQNSDWKRHRGECKKE